MRSIVRSIVCSIVISTTLIRQIGIKVALDTIYSYDWNSINVDTITLILFYATVLGSCLPIKSISVHENCTNVS